MPTSEAAEMCDVSVKTFLRWKDKGRINPVSKLPGLRGGYIFNRSDIEALLPAERVA